LCINIFKKYNKTSKRGHQWIKKIKRLFCRVRWVWLFFVPQSIESDFEFFIISNVDKQKYRNWNRIQKIRKISKHFFKPTRDYILVEIEEIIFPQWNQICNHGICRFIKKVRIKVKNTVEIIQKENLNKRPIKVLMTTILTALFNASSFSFFFTSSCFTFFVIDAHFSYLSLRIFLSFITIPTSMTKQIINKCSLSYSEETTKNVNFQINMREQLLLQS